MMPILVTEAQPALGWGSSLLKVAQVPLACIDPKWCVCPVAHENPSRGWTFEKLRVKLTGLSWCWKARLRCDEMPEMVTDG